MNVREKINAIAAERILILDGAMGSMIQAWRSPDGKPLNDADFRGERFAHHKKPLLGCNDVLCLTKPEVITGIHEAYLQAGADIIETCSLNATSVGLKDYGLEDLAGEISRAAASLARKAADRFSAPDRPRFVAGSIGPTPKSLVFTPDMDNPGKRQITWDELEAAYYVNARGLVEGGADFLLIETIYDGLNAKAALAAVMRLSAEMGRDIPAMVSATVTESGRLLTGQTANAFCASMLHARPLALGLNCSFGIDGLRPPLEKISAFAPCPVIFYPNAGLPDATAHYSDTPEIMASAAELCMKDRLVNIIGGCCGSTPAHIAAIAAAAYGHKPRVIPAESGNKVFLAGTQLAEADNDYLLTVSNKLSSINPWQNALDSGDYEEAINIARDHPLKQNEILAVNTDKAADPVNTLRNFIFLAAAYSDLAVHPILIESGSWDTIAEGLKCFQGRGLVRYTGQSCDAAETARRYEALRIYGALPLIGR
ncbi:MAG: homocysteine S-methyltransferase family protein [Treponema sp.]|nr:homocysteine S-methyltransferase family protein [Treponema sp.]